MTPIEWTDLADGCQVRGASDGGITIFDEIHDSCHLSRDAAEALRDYLDRMLEGPQT